MYHEDPKNIEKIKWSRRGYFNNDQVNDKSINDNSLNKYREQGQKLFTNSAMM